MKKENKKLLIIVGALVLIIGVSFAYFVSELIFNGTGASGTGTTATINGATVTVLGNLEFNDTDILPGHKSVSSIKVNATGDNELVPFNITWTGTNGLGTPLNYEVYKSSTNLTVDTTCETVRGSLNGVTILSEECLISNEASLGDVIASGTIAKSEVETKVVLTTDELTTATSTPGTDVYYYVILEYPNLDEPQDDDMGGSFSGVVSIEKSSATPDITINSIYLANESGNYTATDTVPQSGYILNSTKSSCSNNAVPTYENGEVTISNLVTPETNCSLYFDIES